MGRSERLHRLDLDGLDPRLDRPDIVVASDVDNPLAGPRGAAAVFGPQKGATAEDVELLDAGTDPLVEVLSRQARRRGQGQRTGREPGRPAASGFAAIAVLDATVRPGIESMLELTGFPSTWPVRDLVITGEGSLDEQTLSGKARRESPPRHARPASAVVVGGQAAC